MSDNEQPDPGDKYEGIGCLIICIALAIAIAAPSIVTIIKALR